MKDVKNLKIAYIGGGSRGWARTLMNDLACDGDLAGKVYLYDIDFDAAKGNEKIGNTLSQRDDVKGKWEYIAVKDIKEALIDSDFVMLSVLPGTFDEMESDVHLPEEYGIYQSVGDTVGPGGIVRALRTIPIYEGFAKAIKEYCPDAWVINFTNPMTMCVRTLYKVFPEIKAFGCCHEVFATERMFAKFYKEKYGVQLNRDDVKLNVLGVNHFTWVDKAYYKTEDLFPLLDDFIARNPKGTKSPDTNWANKAFKCTNQVKFDLYKKFGVLAAAGDRHLAEFCPGDWYLKNPETVESFGFNLTTVQWRKEDLAFRIKNTEEYINGKEFELVISGEESVKQIKAILGFNDFVTNVNIPNIGQMPELPIGAVVETNAYFSSSSVRPVFAGSLPEGAHNLVSKIVNEQETVVDCALKGDYEGVFAEFKNDHNVNLPEDKARELFNRMLENTKKYLPKEYFDNYMLTQKN